jgi:large subunit ribosomal protein L21
VSARIVAHEKSRKILVYKKKRRKGYRRHHGHRQNLTTVRVLSVG